MLKEADEMQKKREIKASQATVTKITEQEKTRVTPSENRIDLSQSIRAGVGLDKVKVALRDLDYVSYISEENKKTVSINGRNMNVIPNYIIYSVAAQERECRKYSSYSNDRRIYRVCVDALASDITEFNRVWKDPKVTDLAVRRAWSESSIGQVLYFGHAARLARMYSDPSLYREVTY